MKDVFYQVHTMHGKESLFSCEELIQLSASVFHCDGVEEFTMDELQVDNFLGKRAYSGGNLPLNVLNEVDALFQNNNSKKLVFSFCSSNGKKNAEAFCEELKKSNVSYDLVENDELDWNSEWRKHYKEIKVSDFLNIVPSWQKTKNCSRDVYIYPGMGFGTGDHETTFLCLKHFEDLLASGVKFEHCLDFGCGSGILGIAAIKRSHVDVDFCDIDKNALDNCYQNLQLNFEGMDLNGSTLVSRENYKADKKYDLIFANILEGILIQEKEIILKSLSENGYLIVSGILTDQVEAIVNHYNNLQVAGSYNKGDWSSIAFSKR